MTSEEIVKALREDCKTCSESLICENGTNLAGLYCANKDAADLIERLTAENAALREGASLGKVKRPQKIAYEKSIEFLRALTDGQSDEIKSLRRELEWKDMVISLAQRKQTEAEAERDALREKQRWIPVTERLPEKQAWYHVAIRDKKTMRIAVEQDLYSVETAKNFGHEIGFCKANRWPEREELIAWMPLPKAPEEGDT